MKISDLENALKAAANEIIDTFPGIDMEMVDQMVKIIRYQAHCQIVECEACEGSGKQYFACAKCGGAGMVLKSEVSAKGSA